MLADEVLTPDSSRFWPADDWEPGRPQFSFDKQFVRDWSAGLDWDRTPPGPEVPPEVVAATRARVRRGLRADHRHGDRTWKACSDCEHLYTRAPVRQDSA